MIRKLKSKILKKNKEVVAPSFFDYKSDEKKRIVKKAAKESNKMQLELVKKYKSLYSI
jgi:hypothetical protein